MCGRFTLHTTEARIRKAFHLEHTEPLDLPPWFNIAPSQNIPIIRDTESGPVLAMAKWGHVPAGLDGVDWGRHDSFSLHSLL